jgi:DNA polymerase-3 subunit alpha
VDALWRRATHALKNTVEIAERCSVSFVFGQYQLPHFSLPEGETLESHLERVAREGLLSRFPEDPELSTKKDWSTNSASSTRWGLPDTF